MDDPDAHLHRVPDRGGSDQARKWADDVKRLTIGETAARAAAAAARGAIDDRRRSVEEQIGNLEREAAAARAAVTALDAEVWRLLQAEGAADHHDAECRGRFDAMMEAERGASRPRRGLRALLTLSELRRLRRHAANYPGLVSRIEGAAAALREARARSEEARGARQAAERSIRAAEPRASELAAAVVMLRGEMAWAEEALSAIPAEPSSSIPAHLYDRWVLSHDTMTEGDRRAIRARLGRLRGRPLISVVMPVYNPPVPFLRDAIASVQRQLYPDWELCIADDASPDPAVRQALRDIAAADPRVRLVERQTNGHIAAASNSALALATGEFVALMDHDDLLAEHALFEVAVLLDAHPDTDVIYSDEDHIDANGRRHTPYFKPDFDPDLLLGHNLVSHLGIYRRALVERIGGFRAGFDGSQDYDLALRAADAAGAGRVRHIPAVLYHWRSGTGTDTFSEAAMERCIASARRAIADHLERTGQLGTVVAHPTVPSWHRVARPHPDPAPLVSVIVPTKDGADLLRACAEGVLRRTNYPALELIVVDHQSTAPDALALLDALKADPRVRVLPYAGPFNYSAINNAAVRHARGTVLALLNNDVEVIGPDWLDEMVAQAVRPEVGAVGAKLLYPDGRVQHGGVVLGLGGVAGHLSHGLAGDDPGYCGRAVLTATLSAVTAACLVVRRSVFDAAGGLDEADLPVAFNDVDLCLKIRALGYRNLYAPQAVLVHRESVSRGDDLSGAKLDRFRGEVAFMRAKWGDALDADPAHNPNLTLDHADSSPAFPPRRRKPWDKQQ